MLVLSGFAQAQYVPSNPTIRMPIIILDQASHDYIVRVIWNKVCDDPAFAHLPGEALQSRADKIVLLAKSVVGSSSTEIPSKKVLQWATAEAICAYIARNVRFHVFSGIPGEKRWDANSPDYLLKANQMRAQCSGYAMLGRALANACTASTGLKGEYIWGWTKAPGHDFSASEIGNHGWTLFIFEDGSLSPGDPTYIARGIEATGDLGNSKKKPFAVFCLHFNDIERRYFCASHWGFVPPHSKDSQYDIDFSKTGRYAGQDPTQRLSWDQWNQMDEASFQKIQRQLEPNFRWRFSSGQ